MAAYCTKDSIRIDHQKNPQTYFLQLSWIKPLQLTKKLFIIDTLRFKRLFPPYLFTPLFCYRLLSPQRNCQRSLCATFPAAILHSSVF